MRAQRVKVSKVRGLGALVLLLKGRGLWRVECGGCPETFLLDLTFSTHARAMTFAAAHISGHLAALTLRDPAFVYPPNGGSHA